MDLRNFLHLQFQSSKFHTQDNLDHQCTFYRRCPIWWNGKIGSENKCIERLFVRGRFLRPSRRGTFYFGASIILQQRTQQKSPSWCYILLAASTKNQFPWSDHQYDVLPHPGYAHRMKICNRDNKIPRTGTGDKRFGNFNMCSISGSYLVWNCQIAL